MKLLIVESPGKIKKIKSLLGGGWEVEASVGHVRDLPKGDIGIAFQDGKVGMRYVNSPQKAKAISKMKNASSRAEEIFLAMDPDREGEAIAYHVGMVLGKEHWPKLKRIQFHEITKKAVLAGVESPRKIDNSLVSAQQARRALDRLVGYKVSPLLWKHKGVGSSAGRVQSVAVRMVVERELEIRKFDSKPYWKIKAHLEKQEASGAVTTDDAFWVYLRTYDGKELSSPEAEKSDQKKKERIVLSAKEEADTLVAEFKAGEWKVDSQSEREQKRDPSAPFITSSLQQSASTALGWDAKRTMQIAQKLYEKGHITYMRTDSPTISDEALAAVREFISDNFPAEYLPQKPRVFKTKVANAQEAHECIRPTDVTVTPKTVSQLPDEEQQLYRFIWAQFVASQLTASRHSVVTLDVANGKGMFRAVGKRLLFDGWLKLQPMLEPGGGKGKKKKSEDVDVVLPEVKEGELLKLKTIEPTEHKTKPPARYTEASLIKSLEKHGIGRPSTYASIMDTIKRRGYVKVLKRKLHAEETGIALVQLLMRSFAESFMEYAFTARMEADLDSIAAGKSSWHEMVTDFNTSLEKIVGKTPARQSKKPAVLAKGVVCPKCEQPMVVREGGKGAFYGCSTFPKCRGTREKPSDASS